MAKEEIAYIMSSFSPFAKKIITLFNNQHILYLFTFMPKYFQSHLLYVALCWKWLNQTKDLFVIEKTNYLMQLRYLL